MKLSRFERCNIPSDRYLHIGTFPRPFVREIVIDGAPEYMLGLTALFMSDIHLCDHVANRRLEELVDTCIRLKPDMLLLGGDYADTDESCIRFFKAFSRLDCRFGKYAVCGNHDFDRLEQLKEIAALGGCTFLRNESASVDVGGGRLYIGGCEDHRHGEPVTKDMFPADGYRILVSHVPVFPDCTCELMLSGHTHAGQMAIGCLSPYLLISKVNGCDMLCVRGLHRVDAMRYFVGNGIGVSRIPLRIGTRPEIYTIRFKV